MEILRCFSIFSESPGICFPTGRFAVGRCTLSQRHLYYIDTRCTYHLKVQCLRPSQYPPRHPAFSIQSIFPILPFLNTPGRAEPPPFPFLLVVIIIPWVITPFDDHRMRFLFLDLDLVRHFPIGILDDRQLFVEVLRGKPFAHDRFKPANSLGVVFKVSRFNAQPHSDLMDQFHIAWASAAVYQDGTCGKRASFFLKGFWF